MQDNTAPRVIVPTDGESNVIRLVWSQDSWRHRLRRRLRALVTSELFCEWVVVAVTFVLLALLTVCLDHAIRAPHSPAGYAVVPFAPITALRVPS